MDRLELPRSGDWEVDIVDVQGVEIEDDPYLGLLVVVERPTGLVRMAAPLSQESEILGELINAATEPPEPMLASAPPVIWARQSLLPKLAQAAILLGARLRATDTLTGVDEFITSLQAHLSGRPSFLPPRPQKWRRSFGEWVDEQPWTLLCDTTLFVFSEGDERLRGRVAIVLGQAQEQRGLVLYPDHDACVRFMRRAFEGNASELPQTSCLCVHFDPVEELDEPELAALDDAGLLRDGLALQPMAIENGEARRLLEEEETICLAALEAVRGLVLQHDAELEREPVSYAPIHTTLGPASVVVLPGPQEPPMPPDLLAGRPHAIFVGDGASAELVIKLGKRHAIALARQLEVVDAISPVPRPDGTTDLWLWAGLDAIGTLHLPAGAVWQTWADIGGGILAVYAGGAKRKSLRPVDLVWSDWVDYHDADDLDPGMAELFDEGFGALDTDPAAEFDPAEWAGTPATWPKASEVLVAFAAPLRIDQIPPREAEQALSVAATVFSAVSSADSGNTHTLNMVEELMRSTDLENQGFIQALINRKRQWFAHDTRLMVVRRVQQVRGELKVEVMSSLPGDPGA